MLYLSRKLGESIVINNSIELTVIEVRGKTVKLGFVFPPEATVLRKEIYDKIRAENIAAAGGQGAPADDFLSAEFDLSDFDPPGGKR
jgi:carbon storage regulator